MTLDEALEAVARVHIRFIEQDDWHVEIGATPNFYDAQRYLEAWAVIRQHVIDARDAAQMAATTASNSRRR